MCLILKIAVKANYIEDKTIKEDLIICYLLKMASDVDVRRIKNNNKVENIMLCYLLKIAEFVKETMLSRL